MRALVSGWVSQRVNLILKGKKDGIFGLCKKKDARSFRVCTHSWRCNFQQMRVGHTSCDNTENYYCCCLCLKREYNVNSVYVRFRLRKWRRAFYAFIPKRTIYGGSSTNLYWGNRPRPRTFA